jgi:hypothetical protein
LEENKLWTLHSYQEQANIRTKVKIIPCPVSWFLCPHEKSKDHKEPQRIIKYILLLKNGFGIRDVREFLKPEAESVKIGVCVL